MPPEIILRISETIVLLRINGLKADIETQYFKGMSANNIYITYKNVGIFGLVEVFFIKQNVQKLGQNH